MALHACFDYVAEAFFFNNLNATYILKILILRLARGFCSSKIILFHLNIGKYNIFLFVSEHRVLSLKSLASHIN